jgi:predicted RNA-binding protein YlqC (UPF0109 family)
VSPSAENNDLETGINDPQESGPVQDQEEGGLDPDLVQAAKELITNDDGELNLGQERVLEFVSYVVVNLVDHPEDVTVDLVRRQDRDIYQVRVHGDDLGKVIGKGGQTARALRVMLTALSARTDQRIGLEIVE